MMTRDQLSEIAKHACKLPLEKRNDFLASTCDGDPLVLAEVESLMAVSEMPNDVSGATVTHTPPTTPQLPAGFSRQIGPYTLLDQVGEGGMGTVYRAEQRQPIRRTVAVKIIRGDFGSSNVIARFEAERQALARMDHPNIAKILDAGTHAGLPFFVMELVPGAPITRFCDEQMMNIRQRLELFIQVCEAIAHAHTKAILHRDIKSSNVLAYIADGKPVAKVIDFGIAKALSDDRLSDRLDRTQVGRVIGTYESMSPEQAEGIADIDTRTDVYALGVLLYELLCGVKPFAAQMVPGIAVMEVHRIIREVNPPAPSTRISSDVAKVRQTGQSELVKRLRTELDWIPLKACRKERDRRYESVAQLIEDVQNYLNGWPLLAGPDSRVYRLKKFTRRNKGTIAAAVSIVLVLLLGIVGTSVGLVKETRQRHTAEKATIEADHQRDNANATVAFLTDDVIEQVSPGRTFDRNAREILVKNLLQPASEKVEKRFADKPLVEASIRDMLGLTFNDLGRSDLAQPHVQSAYDLRMKYLGPDNLDSISALCDLAFVVQSSGKAADAETYYKKALAQCQGRFGVDNPVMIKLLGNYGECVKQLGRLDEARGLYAKAVSAAHERFGDDAIQTLSLQSNYADLLLKLGSNAEAETLLHDVWTTSRKTAGDNDEDTVQYMDHYAVALDMLGHPEKAKPLAFDAWQRRRAGLGENNPQTVNSLNNYAEILWQLGHFIDALPLAEKAWTQRRDSLGNDAPDTRESLNNYAHTLFSAGQLPLATDYFKQLYECNLRLEGPDAAATAATQRTYAQALKAQGRWDLATPRFKELWDRNLRVLGKDDPETIAACNRYGDAVLAIDGPANAQPIYHQALQAAEQNKAMGYDDSRTRLYAKSEAACLDRLQRTDEAASLRNRFGLNIKSATTSR